MMGKFCSRMMQMVAGHCRYIKFHRIVNFKMLKQQVFCFGCFTTINSYQEISRLVELDCALWDAGIGPLMCSQGWVADTKGGSSGSVRLERKLSGEGEWDREGSAFSQTLFYWDPRPVQCGHCRQAGPLSRCSAEKESRGFPGGWVVKNPPAGARRRGSLPGPGRSHVLQSNRARVQHCCDCGLESGNRDFWAHLLQVEAWTPQSWCSMIRAATARRSPSPATKEQTPLATAREKPTQQRRPSTAKNK